MQNFAEATFNFKSSLKSFKYIKQWVGHIFYIQLTKNETSQKSMFIAHTLIYQLTKRPSAEAIISECATRRTKFVTSILTLHRDD